MEVYGGLEMAKNLRWAAVLFVKFLMSHLDHHFHREPYTTVTGYSIGLNYDFPVDWMSFSQCQTTLTYRWGWAKMTYLEEWQV